MSPGQLLRRLRGAFRSRPRQPDVLFKVERFSYAPVTVDTVLVRLRGSWRAAPDAEMPDPLLVIGRDRSAHRLAPLRHGYAALDGAGGGPAPWHASYLAPFEAFTEARPFAVELPALLATPLAAPTPERGAQPRPRDGERIVLGDLHTKLAELRTGVASLRLRVGEAPADALQDQADVASGAGLVLESRLREQRARAEALAAAAASANTRAAQAEARAALADSSLVEFRDRVAHLEHREADLVLRLSEMQPRAHDAERARAALEARADKLSVEVVELERLVAEHALRRSRIATRAQDSEAARAALQARALDLEDQVAELRRHSTRVLSAGPVAVP
jgi:hypothetical protein